MPKSKENAPAPKRKKANGYKFPDPIPSGLVVTDTKKKDWEFGNSIGKGGFAEVYCASECNKDASLKSKVKRPFAIKIEPKDNGPLYCEMHFYMRVGKPEDIEEWKKDRKLSHFGMAPFLGSGHFIYKSQSYRFLVTDRFGKSIFDLIAENEKQLPVETTLQIAVQLIDLLEYIHTKGYIHGDIKAANLLLGLKPGTEHCIHIVDYGMAKKFKKEVEELPNDPRLAHNGTIEYISRDGHTGVFGRRGDLEMLGFNLLHWINATLPWEKDIADQHKVEQKKVELMQSPSKCIKKTMPKTPAVLAKFLEYVSSLKNNEEPDYSYCRKLFANELSKSKCSPYGKLEFRAKAEEGEEEGDEGARKGRPKKKGKPDGGRQKREGENGDVSPPKRLRGGTPKAANGNLLAGSDEESANGVPEDSPKKRPQTARAKAKAKPNDEKVDDGDGRSNAENKEAVSAKSRSKKKKDEPVASWKDAPTAVASKVMKAGEYKKNAVPFSKRK